MGKSIRIFLADTVASGIRHGEIVNWSGQGIVCPRARILELQQWSETHKPGVYCLFGTDTDGREAAYIGEAENVFDRLKSHIRNKDFWNEAVVLTSKDDNLTKAHVRFLECQLYKFALEANRYAIENTNTPQEASLPRGDKDAMQEFLDNARILLGVFGYRLLDAPVRNAHTSLNSPQNAGMPAYGGIALTEPIPSPSFFLRTSALVAEAVRSDEGLVVIAGSEASRENTETFSKGYEAHKERLVAEGVLQVNGFKFRFTRDYAFPSPTQAASIIVGYPINGREAWRTADGRSYKQFEEAEVAVPSGATAQQREATS